MNQYLSNFFYLSLIVGAICGLIIKNFLTAFWTKERNSFFYSFYGILLLLLLLYSSRFFETLAWFKTPYYPPLQIGVLTLCFVAGVLLFAHSLIINKQEVVLTILSIIPLPIGFSLSLYHHLKQPGPNILIEHAFLLGGIFQLLIISLSEVGRFQILQILTESQQNVLKNSTQSLEEEVDNFTKMLQEQNLSLEEKNTDFKESIEYANILKKTLLLNMLGDNEQFLFQKIKLLSSNSKNESVYFKIFKKENHTYLYFVDGADFDIAGIFYGLLFSYKLEKRINEMGPLAIQDLAPFVSDFFLQTNDLNSTVGFALAAFDAKNNLIQISGNKILFHPPGSPSAQMQPLKLEKILNFPLQPGKYHFISECGISFEKMGVAMNMWEERADKLWEGKREETPGEEPSILGVLV